MGREILKLPYKSFKKKKDFLVCVDSDGCAMDTMDIKHFRCFGPCMIDEWGLHENADEILARWNEINLYSKTRGINRFKGLSRALAEINEKQGGIEGTAALAEWVKTSPELSNDALVRKIAEEPCEVIFKKALNWSRATKEAITKLPEEEIKPFPLAREALMLAHENTRLSSTLHHPLRILSTVLEYLSECRERIAADEFDGYYPDKMIDRDAPVFGFLR